MSLAYTYNSKGYFAGVLEDCGFLPANATYTQPPDDKEGFVQQWDGEVWDYDENHIGEHGWVDGVYTEIKEYGPLPEGWRTDEQHEEDRKEAFYADVPTAKAEVLRQIDGYTSGKIAEGFDYTVNRQLYHFNYGTTEQQNFADTANLILVKKSQGTVVVLSIPWDAYKDGVWTQVVMGGDTFLDLYEHGALAHKTTCTEDGAILKTLISSATTSKDLREAADNLPFEVIIP